LKQRIIAEWGNTQ